MSSKDRIIVHHYCLSTHIQRVKEYLALALVIFSKFHPHSWLSNSVASKGDGWGEGCLILNED